VPLKVLTVFGTRPEAVKLGPVIRELARYPERIISRVCVTAQHREMLDQVLRIFAIQPDYDLDVMQDNQTPTQVAASVLARLEPILIDERPDWVLVRATPPASRPLLWPPFTPEPTSATSKRACARAIAGSHFLKRSTAVWRA
jgi:hypothetical protein